MARRFLKRRELQYFVILSGAKDLCAEKGSVGVQRGCPRVQVGSPPAHRESLAVETELMRVQVESLAVETELTRVQVEVLAVETE